MPGTPFINVLPVGEEMENVEIVHNAEDIRADHLGMSRGSWYALAATYLAVAFVLGTAMYSASLVVLSSFILLQLSVELRPQAKGDWFSRFWRRSLYVGAVITSSGIGVLATFEAVMHLRQEDAAVHLLVPLTAAAALLGQRYHVRRGFAPSSSSLRLLRIATLMLCWGIILAWTATVLGYDAGSWDASSWDPKLAIAMFLGSTLVALIRKL